MSQPERMARAVEVVDGDGVRARVEELGSVDGTPHALVRLADGTAYLIPRAAFVELKEGGYFVSSSFRDLTPYVEEQQSAHTRADAVTDATRTHATTEYAVDRHGVAAGDEVLVVPVVEETLRVDKRQVESGRVRITKRVDEREEIIDELLQSEEAIVERVPVNRVVEAAPPVRYEGDVMVVPLVEEELVVERRLVVREELRVSKRMTEKREPQRVVLRREDAIVERVDATGAVNPDGFAGGAIPNDDSGAQNR